MHPKRVAQSIVRQAKAALSSQSESARVAQIRDALRVPAPAAFETALFNFTVDFELWWGNGDLGGYGHSVERRIEAARRQAENFAPFVEMIGKLRFPISWAVLGVLADPEIRLADSQRFKPAWHAGDWYAMPDEVRARPELWNGKSYLAAIRERLPFCEVLSHGYAHIDYADPSTTEEIARADLEVSRAALEKAGFDAKGFVFPCNRRAHERLAREAGFTIARGSSADWVTSGELVQTPIGFWISPGVMSLREARALVLEAIRNRSFLHPWMHLIECDLRCRDLRDFYRPLFETVLEEQARGRIRNLSFGEIRSFIQ